MGFAKMVRCVCLCLAHVHGRAFVKSIIFYNDPNARAATTYFSEPIVVENILVSKKIDGENSVDIASLSRSIIEPEDYGRKVFRAMKTNDPSSTNYKEAMTSHLKVDLNRVDFRENEVYSFKIKPLDSGSPMYSETFVYSGGNLMYEQEKKRGHWYTNIWVWCSVVLMVLIFLLLVKLCCY